MGQTVAEVGEVRRRHVFVREYVAVGYHELLDYHCHRSRKMSIPGTGSAFEFSKLGALFLTGPYADPLIQNVDAVDAWDILVIAHVGKQI